MAMNISALNTSTLNSYLLSSVNYVFSAVETMGLFEVPSSSMSGASAIAESVAMADATGGGANSSVMAAEVSALVSVLSSLMSGAQRSTETIPTVALENSIAYSQVNKVEVIPTAVETVKTTSYSPSPSVSVVPMNATLSTMAGGQAPVVSAVPLSGQTATQSYGAVNVYGVWPLSERATSTGAATMAARELMTLISSVSTHAQNVLSSVSLLPISDQSVIGIMDTVSLVESLPLVSRLYATATALSKAADIEAMTATVKTDASGNIGAVETVKLQAAAISAAGLVAVAVETLMSLEVTRSTAAMAQLVSDRAPLSEVAAAMAIATQAVGDLVMLREVLALQEINHYAVSLVEQVGLSESVSSTALAVGAISQVLKLLATAVNNVGFTESFVEVVPSLESLMSQAIASSAPVELINMLGMLLSVYYQYVSRAPQTVKLRMAYKVNYQLSVAKTAVQNLVMVKSVTMRLVCQ